MIIDYIRYLIAYHKREKMYQGILALRKNLNEMRAEGTIEDKKACDLLMITVKEYAAMF